jgi:hypothetical protein
MKNIIEKNTTLVTACFDTTKYNPNGHNFEKFTKSLNILLNIPIYLIIHSDSVYMPYIRETRKKFGYDDMTIYIEERIEDLWAAQYLELIKQNRKKYWPTHSDRDCAERQVICCNKVAFVLDAIKTNPFQTKRFGWIDSNLHLEKDTDTSSGKEVYDNSNKICEDYTDDKIPMILSNIKDEKFHIQILNFVDKRFLKREFKREYYDEYRWLVCGCFWICGANIGEKICLRVMEIIDQTTRDGYGHGEEMFFLEILEEFKEDIVRSYGNYGQILNNFLFPTRNLWYITCATVYESFKYHSLEECMDCCNAMIDVYENGLVEMDMYNYCIVKTFMRMCLEQMVERERRLENGENRWQLELEKFHDDVFKRLSINEEFCTTYHSSEEQMMLIFIPLQLGRPPFPSPV